MPIAAPAEVREPSTRKRTFPQHFQDLEPTAKRVRPAENSHDTAATHPEVPAQHTEITPVDPFEPDESPWDQEPLKPSKPKSKRPGVVTVVSSDSEGDDGGDNDKVSVDEASGDESVNKAILTEEQVGK